LSASQNKDLPDIPADASVIVTVGNGPRSDKGSGLIVALEASMPGGESRLASFIDDRQVALKGPCHPSG